MENIDLEAPKVVLAPTSNGSDSVKNGSINAANGFVPLVTVVGFHHAR
jgi:hypothetical protein